MSHVSWMQQCRLDKLGSVDEPQVGGATSAGIYTTNSCGSWSSLHRTRRRLFVDLTAWVPGSAWSGLRCCGSASGICRGE